MVALNLFVYAIAIGISTVALAASLFLLEDMSESTFRIDGKAKAWAKCAGIALVVTLLAQFPNGGLPASIVAFFVGILALFEKTFMQALLLFLVNSIFGLGVFWVLVTAIHALSRYI